MLPALPATAVALRASVGALGDDLDVELRAALAALPPPGSGDQLNLGIAHGWGGVLFALLRWREASLRGGADAAVEGYLRDLASQAEVAGEGLRWRWISPEQPGLTRFMPGWCNGSAGLVHLLTLAERTIGGKDHGELARRAALNAYQEALAIGDLCCGASGRSYAMLNLYRHSGDEVWLQRARELADKAATLIGRWATWRNSLYKGDVGVALLIADLERPELSGMPLFDGEP